MYGTYRKIYNLIKQGKIYRLGKMIQLIFFKKNKTQITNLI